MQPVKQLFHTLGGSFRTCMMRFPVTVAFVLAWTAYLLYLIARGRFVGDERLLLTLGYYLSVGAVLSLSLHLWGEEVKTRRTAYIVHFLAQMLLLGDAVFLYYHVVAFAVGIVVAHGAALLALGLSVFFLSFFREKDDIPAWNFAQYVLGMLALVIIVGAIMSGGLCLLAFSLYQLFGVDISVKCYRYILVLCSVALPSLMFLGLLPQGSKKHDRFPQPTAFLNNITRYLFLPLAGGYLLLLYVYAARILVRWELPDGWVSWLVVTLMAGCIAIEFCLYSTRLRDGRRIDEWIARLLPALALPLLLLMTVGIVRRFMDYGITLNRLYLATLNGWFYLVCIGLLVTRARRISWIPISFSIIFLLTSVLPVNYASITRSALRGEIAEALAQGGQTGSLPLSEGQYDAWMRSLPETEAVRISGKLWYLIDWYGRESINGLVDKNIPVSHLDVEPEGPEIEHLSYDQPYNTTVKLPNGYRLCTFVRIGCMLADETVRDSMLFVPMDNGADTVCIPFDTLYRRERDRNLPPALLKTCAGNILMLSSFTIYLSKKYEETETVISGYLFHNE